MSEASRLWCELSFPRNSGLNKPKFWVINNSAQTLHTIHAFNASRTADQHRGAANLSTFDCERLFTNIDQPVAKTRLSAFLARVSGFRPDKPVVSISARGVATWQAGVLPPERMIYGDGQKHYHFDLASAQQLLALIVDNAYLTVGDRLYRQK